MLLITMSKTEGLMEVEVKHFTPKEAQRTLPLVRKIVDDILVEGREVKLLAEDLNGNLEGDERIRVHMDRINSYMEELKEIGCYYKDWGFQAGLVDFPSMIDGEEVYLCWKSDEPAVLFYHPVNAGFAGRKPIPKKYLE